MQLFNRIIPSFIDNKFKKLGFRKYFEEQDYINDSIVSVVIYKRYVLDLSPYTHEIKIVYEVYKGNCNQYIYSYQGENNTDGLYNSVPLTKDLAKLCIKKCNEMKRNNYGNASRIRK